MIVGFESTLEFVKQFQNSKKKKNILKIVLKSNISMAASICFSRFVNCFIIRIEIFA